MNATTPQQDGLRGKVKPLDPRINNAFKAAYNKGLQAGKTGQHQALNPYPDFRDYRGCVTFSRAFRRYWHTGWKHGAAGCTCPKPCFQRDYIFYDGWSYAADCKVPDHVDERALRTKRKHGNP